MYILYNPVKSTTINNIINYIAYLGYDLVPKNIIDNKISVIQTEQGEVYIGEKECIQFYTDQTLIMHLSDKANYFNRYHKIKIE